MYTTQYGGIEYSFSDRELRVKGIPIPYREMRNIAHRKGEVPAFLFEYKGRRYALPYPPQEIRKILPYFLYAQRLNAQADQPAPAYAEPEPGYTEPSPAYAEPEPEYTEPAPAYVEEEIAFEPVTEKSPYEGMAGEEEPTGEPAEEEPAFAGEEPVGDRVVMEPDADIGGLGEEPAPQDKKGLPTSRKILIGVIALLVIGAICFFVFGHRGGDEAGAGAGAVEQGDMVTEELDETYDDEADTASDDDFAPPQNSGDEVEATAGFTVTDPDGTMSVKLKEAYVGDSAFNKLAELGENKDDFTEDLESSYKLVLYEYEVEVLNGMLIGDPITGEMYMPDKKTVLEDWWSYDLAANADKDLAAGNVEMSTKDSGSVYCVYAVPADLNDYYEQVYTDLNDTTIWVHYVLK